MKKEQIDIKNLPDEDLVNGCIQNNRRYQHELFRRYYGKMKAICYRYSCNNDEADDLVQDSFIKIFKNIHTYQDKSTLFPWIKRITINTIIDYLRQKKNIFDDIETVKYKIEADNDTEEIKDVPPPHIIIKQIQKLSPQYRTVFNMFIFEGFSHQEIADKLNIKVGTSKSNLAKAKKKLKTFFSTIYNKSEML